jgi:hypothetical protein
METLIAILEFVREFGGLLITLLLVGFMCGLAHISK